MAVFKLTTNCVKNYYKLRQILKTAVLLQIASNTDQLCLFFFLREKSHGVITFLENFS